MRYFTVWKSGICSQCGKCVLVCPIRDKPEHKAVNMASQPPLRLHERELAFLIVRRQNDGRQRHRLFVDLRRQSAGDVPKLIQA